ncbi:MAG: hypothetical protein JW747_01805, partial [Candidatus Aminicenantes bacterium]|nr:hypothetical protein [Candidatus Aminicenantes bacterium]
MDRGSAQRLFILGQNQREVKAALYPGVSIPAISFHLETSGERKGLGAWRGSNRGGSSGFLSRLRDTLPFG